MFWLKDITVLLDDPLDFFPDKDQTKDERLNSITRLSLYIAIAMSFHKKSGNYMWIFIAMLLFTMMLHNSSIDYLENAISGVTSPLFTVKKADPFITSDPTVENPFMNATLGEYLKIGEDGNVLAKPPALDISNPEVKKRVADLFFNGDPQGNIDDFYNKDGGQRQFLSMPSTSIPADREEFQNWVYKIPARCKEDSNCLVYEDLRANRPVFGNKYENSNKISK